MDASVSVKTAGTAEMDELGLPAPMTPRLPPSPGGSERLPVLSWRDRESSVAGVSTGVLRSLVCVGVRHSGVGCAAITRVTVAALAGPGCERIAPRDRERRLRMCSAAGGGTLDAVSAAFLAVIVLAALAPWPTPSAKCEGTNAL